jgi:hypothetical protein
MHLFELPWWTRIWVVQEAVLARKLSVHCGVTSCSWEYFQSGADAIMLWMKFKGVGPHKSLVANLREAESEQFEPWIPLNVLRESHHNGAQMRLEYLV